MIETLRISLTIVIDFVIGEIRQVVRMQHNFVSVVTHEELRLPVILCLEDRALSGQ